jgi:hypothetical protein
MMADGKEGLRQAADSSWLLCVHKILACCANSCHTFILIHDYVCFSHSQAGAAATPSLPPPLLLPLLLCS